MRNPRCFVAMAFDHPDTDALYERAIEPVLRDAGITPIIINRRQSNDDLNNQIVGQLRDADFCLTDLTYARPSVYFEAGFAQRQVEVIYTVRADHLNPDQPEHLRVHFDLQMKPLIRWRNPDDRRFRAALRRRLNGTVMKSWRAQQRATAIQSAERSTFAAMSLAQRVLNVRRVAVRAFVKMGFHDWVGAGSYPASVPDPLRSGQDHEYLRGMRSQRRQLEIATVQVFRTVRKREWAEVRPLFSRFGFQDHLASLRRDTRSIIIHRAILSLTAIKLPSAEAAFPNLRRGARPGHLLYRDEHEHLSDKGSQEYPLVVNLYLISGLHSEAEFATALVADLDPTVGG